MHVEWRSTTEGWQEIVDGSPSATIYHTPAWARLYETAGEWRVLHAAWPDGRRALVPVGLRRSWRGLVRVAEVGFDGGYGGVMANGPLGADEERAIYEAVRRRFPELRVVSNPLSRPPVLAVDGESLDPTYLIPLGPLADMERRYAPERRRIARRARESGLGLSVIHRPGAGELATFLRLYALEIQGWQDRAWVRPESWFRRLWREAAHHLTMIVATVDGEVGGVELSARQGTVATGLFLAWDRRFAAMQLPTALLETSFVTNHQAGCRFHDLMPCNEPGVERFKRSFGAEARPVQRWYFQSSRVRHLEALRRHLSQPLAALEPRHHRPGPAFEAEG